MRYTSEHVKHVYMPHRAWRASRWRSLRRTVRTVLVPGGMGGGMKVRRHRRGPAVQGSDVHTPVPVSPICFSCQYGSLQHIAGRNALRSACWRLRPASVGSQISGQQCSRMEKAVTSRYSQALQLCDCAAKPAAESQLLSMQAERSGYLCSAAVEAAYGNRYRSRLVTCWPCTMLTSAVHRERISR